MTINSRRKGARGERQWRDELRAQGYEARRGQQFSGAAESPDAVCPSLSWIHFEVKAVERLNLEEPGQAYVAVSRVRSLSGLFFKDWFKGVHVSPEAIRFYKEVM